MPSGFCDAAQAVDQFPPGAGRQAVHAQRGMTRVIEVVDHIERQAVTVGEPFDQRPGTPRDGIDDCLIGLAMCLALDIGGKQVGAVDDGLVALETGAGGGDEPRRQRGRAGRYGVALDENGLDAGLLGGQRGAQSGGAGADDQ